MVSESISPALRELTGNLQKKYGGLTSRLHAFPIASAKRERDSQSLEPFNVLTLFSGLVSVCSIKAQGESVPSLIVKKEILVYQT